MMILKNRNIKKFLVSLVAVTCCIIAFYLIYQVYFTSETDVTSRIVPLEGFNLDEFNRPLQDLDNRFTAQGEVVVDHAARLMWDRTAGSGPIGYDDTSSYIRDLNRYAFAGFQDWRLPSLGELLTLVELMPVNGEDFIDPVFDPVNGGGYWTADMRSEEKAWAVSFWYGSVHSYNVENARRRVRAVRSLRFEDVPSPAEPPTEGAPEIRYRLRNKPRTPPGQTEELEKLLFGLDKKGRPRQYVQNRLAAKGEVVIDYATGLLWQRTGTDHPLSYAEALNYTEETNQRGISDFHDWRLPTIPELLSVLEPKQKNSGGSIDPVFQYTPGGYWSADICVEMEAAWVVLFHLGIVDCEPMDAKGFVRLVRNLKDRG